MLETLFGMMYRQADGRDGRPMQWNAYLYIGLAYICYAQFGFEWVALAVYAITIVNIASGYHSFTLKWFDDAGGGFHSWHTLYRFLIPSIIVCSLTSFNWWWLGATVVSGAIFPASVMAIECVNPYKRDFYGELFANVREAILGGVLIGGLMWV